MRQRIAHRNGRPVRDHAATKTVQLDHCLLFEHLLASSAHTAAQLSTEEGRTDSTAQLMSGCMKDLNVRPPTRTSPEVSGSTFHTPGSLNFTGLEWKCHLT